MITINSVPDQLWMAREEQDPPSEDNLKPVENSTLYCKPHGGFWTSTFTPDGQYPSDWLRWCGSECWAGAGMEVYRLKVEDGLNLIEIDSLLDLQMLANQYAAEISDMPITDFEFDFEQMAEDGYDGIHLTEKGQHETRMPGFGKPNLYGWDSESTLWFNWAFESSEYLGTASEEGLKIEPAVCDGCETTSEEPLIPRPRVKLDGSPVMCLKCYSFEMAR